MKSLLEVIRFFYVFTTCLQQWNAANKESTNAMATHRLQHYFLNQEVSATDFDTPSLFQYNFIFRIVRSVVYCMVYLVYCNNA
uniref:Secreted protein n=1 Tax=Heterorhabditis bacteriophora TaxID=37862 RepID=A0A1I7W7J4_HETBA